MISPIDIAIAGSYLGARYLRKKRGGTPEAPHRVWDTILVLGPLAVAETSMAIWAMTLALPFSVHLYQIVAALVAVQLLFYGSPYNFLASQTRGLWMDGFSKFRRLQDRDRKRKEREAENKKKAISNPGLNDFLVRDND